MKKATIKDVAARAGVSISVVSYVLNDTKGKTISEQTRMRVKKAAEELCYIPNRFAGSMRTSKTKLIGVVLFWNMQSRVAMRLLKGITQRLAEDKYHLVLCSVDDSDEFSYIKLFLDGSIDAVIFVSPFSTEKIIDETEHIKKMRENNIPFVIVNGDTEAEDICYINIDVKKTSYSATDYLINKGYKDIVYVSAVLSGSKEFELRRLGYEERMKCEGLDIKEMCEGDFEIKKGMAIVANKSDTAHKIYLKAADKRLVPGKDFSIVAANTDSFSAFMIPPLTRVDTPIEALGQQAAQEVEKLINKEVNASEIVKEYKLTEGKSVIAGGIGSV